MTLQKLVPKSEIERICRFIESYVSKAHAAGAVLGLSGGIDSAVVAFLVAKSLGKEKVLGVLMFEDDSKNSNDYKDARSVASQLEIPTLELGITPIVSSVTDRLHIADRNLSRLTLANIKSRSRMILLYGLANQRNLLVAGTGDKSEIELGYFTKYGDGGVDFLPIGHLYKTEVLALGKTLGVPRRIITKPSSPRLWKNQRATDELPADYPILDLILTELFEHGQDPTTIARDLRLNDDMIARALDLHQQSRHKRFMPKSLRRIVPKG